MRAPTAIVTALAVLALPAAASAAPDAGERADAAAECRAERGTTAATKEAFRERYGTNRNKRNAFGKCVSQRARAEEREQARARVNASKQCKAEAEQLGAEAFAAKHGTGKKGRNAHGRCVSQRARELEEQADARDAEEIEARRSAARTCAAERRELGPAAFRDKHGTNRNKRNAFGKCVSKTAKELREEDDAGSDA